MAALMIDLDHASRMPPRKPGRQCGMDRRFPFAVRFAVSPAFSRPIRRTQGGVPGDDDAATTDREVAPREQLSQVLLDDGDLMGLSAEPASGDDDPVRCRRDDGTAGAGMPVRLR
jgi:hypothetical protein